MAQNFKTVHQKEKVTATWICTGILIVFILLSVFIPLMDKIPSVAYSAFFTILTGSMARKYQAGFIENHINAGGQYHTTGRVIIITLIGLILLLAFVFGLFFYMDSFQRN